jgi:hypothetical protein
MHISVHGSAMPGNMFSNGDPKIINFSWQPDDDDRALMISRFIRLAKSLKQVRNYNSTMAVYMALTGAYRTAVVRLLISSLSVISGIYYRGRGVWTPILPKDFSVTKMYA